jgi:hypothetical protein
VLNQLDLEPQIRLANEARLGSQQALELRHIAFVYGAHEPVPEECLPRHKTGGVGPSWAYFVLAHVLDECGAATPVVDPASQLRTQRDSALQQECGCRFLFECTRCQECLVDDISRVARAASSWTQHPALVEACKSALLVAERDQKFQRAREQSLIKKKADQAARARAENAIGQPRDDRRTGIDKKLSTFPAGENALTIRV